MAGKRILTVPIFLLVSALLFLSIGPGSGVQAHNWVTKYNLWLDGAKTSAPGVSATSLTAYDIDATAGGTNFDTIISATGYPEANIAMDLQIPDGSSIGDITSNTTLALMQSTCSVPIQVVIPFMDCTTDTLKTAPWVGSGDNLVQDNDGDRNEDGSAAAQGTGNCIDGIENDAVPDGIDNNDPDCINEATDNNGLPTYCDHYPAYLNDMFDDIRPRARYMGHTVVLADSPASMLTFVIFNPEALSALPTVAGTLGDTYGYLDFVVLDNPTQPASPSTITDFCSPLQSLPTLLGTTDGSYTVLPGPEPYEATAVCGNGVDNDGDGWDDDGCLVKSTASPYYQRNENPAPLTGLFGTGTHVVRTYSMSQRDADGDTVANNFDTCPYTANTGVDADGDRIDSACDLETTWYGPGAAPGCYNDGIPDNCPSPGAPATCLSPGLFDEDQDCFPNLQDNCPLMPNGDPYAPVVSGKDQSDTDNLPGNPEPTDNGPGRDAIGDACDNNPNKADGHFHVASPIDAVCMPDPNGGDDGNNDGNSDDDNDGWCDVTEAMLNSCPRDPCTDYGFPGGLNAIDSTPEHIVLDLLIGTGTAAQAPGTCSDFDTYNHPDAPAGGIDNDGDTLANGNDPDCQSPNDTDKDGVPDGMDNCPDEKNPEQVDSDADGYGNECDDDDDNDGFLDAWENNTGTDPKDNCSDGGSPGNPGVNDAWPADFDKDADADIVDVMKFKPVILTYKGIDPGYILRPDFDADGDIDIVDVMKFKPIILTDCLSSEEIHANLLEDPESATPGSCEDGIDNGGDGDGTDGADTDCQVDDITIQWKVANEGFISATDDDGGTWSVVTQTPYKWELARDSGVMHSDKTLTIKYNAPSPIPSRCYDWSLDGTMKNSSDKPCSFRNDTGGNVYGIHFRFKWASYGGVLSCEPHFTKMNVHFPPAKDIQKDFTIALPADAICTFRPWIPSRYWELKNWYWTNVAHEPIYVADKFVSDMYLDEGDAYPDEGTLLAEAPADVFTYPGTIPAGEQRMVSVISVDENAGPKVPAKSNVTFLADIPLDCHGMWVKDTPWPYDVLTTWTALLDPDDLDLMSQLTMLWDVPPVKVAGTETVRRVFESDLHFQPNDYGEWEEVGVPLNLLRFFNFHCDAAGEYTFELCNKIEPKGHGFGDPDMTNNYKCVDMIVNVVAP